MPINCSHLSHKHKMKNYIKLILLFVGFTAVSNAVNIADKYPSYSYVFNEFDIDKSYIYDAEFSFFVMKNEKYLKAFYKRSLKRGKEILPTMKGLLLEDGVSDLFIYLSMIESGFSTSVVSPKKAVGLWQFMPATAKRFNLKVCNDYDERCDTSSSTSAAMKYLNKLHKQFGKWYLAAMAYNCGEGCLERAIKQAGTDEIRTLTDDGLKYLPKETRDYIKKILLVAMIGENATLGFSQNYNNTSDSTITEVEVSAGTDLKEVASLLKMKYKELKQLNQKILNGQVTNKSTRYKINIPMEKIFAFYLRYEFNKSIKGHLVSHYVTLGETLSSIAKIYKTDVQEIIRANHLENTYLELEQFLVIPVNKKIFEKTFVGTSK